MKRLVLAVCAVAVVAGCSGASNSGGATSCTEFLAMRTEDRDATVAKLLKERNGRNASTTDVINTRLRLVEACEPENRRDASIGSLS